MKIVFMVEPRRIDVHFEPDHDAVTFDAVTPALTWTRYGKFGWGWSLWTAESDVDGGGNYFIGGSFIELERAVESAREYLRWWADGPGLR